MCRGVLSLLPVQSGRGKGDGMISKKRERRWNPYLTGALTGLLAIASAYATTRVTGRTVYLGASTTIVRATAEIERRILPGHASRNAYLKV